MIYSLVKPRGRKDHIMTKIETYKEVSNVVEMVELILKKFHADMLENNIVSSVFCCYEDYFTVLHPLK